MPPTHSFPFLLQAAVDHKRDAGLRGDEYDAAVLGLIAVFVFGFGVIGAVLLLARRKRNADKRA